ncbi:hypothetical protein QTI51_22880 [Variovorax sp. J22G73]|uniref:hypothetical protein n=1 Tax=unclassified Variovorax TaxID=663243 RepID=UPI002578208D|nr:MULTISPECIES: hypothetical protein [unclassified Variovorax]MDM0007490.1 hypothetical protein [Variovorax sp. J22R203]MDM0100150.1 hypothetical protein [Variovorax sp. J22G73]
MKAQQVPTRDVEAHLAEQPSDVRSVQDGAERHALAVSLRRVNGDLVPVSVYGDAIWWLTGNTTNTAKSHSKIDFGIAPASIRETAKAMMYRYQRRGIRGQRRPGAATMVATFNDMVPFFRYLAGLGIANLAKATPMVCLAYVQASRDHNPTRGPRKPGADPEMRRLSAGKLYKRLKAVEMIFELSQYSDDAMLRHPWEDSSATFLSGASKGGVAKGGLTPLMPDDVFTILFQKAWAKVQDAPRLLDLRDEMEQFDQRSDVSPKYHAQLKTKRLRTAGLSGYRELKKLLVDIRVACYIVVASLSGCRAHEMANIQGKNYHSTEVDGERYWWLRSVSSKTFEGKTEWMVPEAAIEALQVMDRWSEPYQRLLRKEVEGYRASDPADIRIAEAQAHLGAVFVGTDLKKGNIVRTLSVQQMNENLKDFAAECKVDWVLATHQFRRKFANYAARSRFGDLRYLREHFKHWSMDMTLGYALNESQEMQLYLEIQDEFDEFRIETVSSWLNENEPLAGGYGRSLVAWRSKGENISLFKSRAAMVKSIALSTPLRSNGHAWCTAADSMCVGNDLDRTRCGDGCDNAVVGRRHEKIYRGLYDHLKELEDLQDIGPGGRARVARDLGRCATVLAQLGVEASAAHGHP